MKNGKILYLCYGGLMHSGKELLSIVPATVFCVLRILHLYRPTGDFSDVGILAKQMPISGKREFRR